jgi:Arc/MetJ-type ribon-helix-helix transcriptional regulator
MPQKEGFGLTQLFLCSKIDINIAIKKGLTFDGSGDILRSLEAHAMTPKAMRVSVNRIQDNKIYTTTVRLPSDLHDEVKSVLKEDAFGSFNELLVAAVENLLRVLREKAVDLQFARMADDENYQKVAINLYNLFENSAAEEHARAPGQSVPQVVNAWSEGLARAAVRSDPRPSIKARG